MAYDEHLAERIRSILDARKINYLDKKMMGGLVFMVDDKMCIGIVKDNLMARIGEEKYPEALQKDGCKEMNFTGRPLKGYVFVEPQAVDMEDELEYWVKLCLDFNPLAKASKKRK
ncbi:MAG: TfoX/Sxy family protein [Saprospiraceae bacterium]|nr:TfoX/Sxy family protein [Saprospiraceae bacterium]MCB9326804.1 TfoX/Sxy family protein [Lewinellaceae bacterium]